MGGQRVKKDSGGDLTTSVKEWHDVQENRRAMDGNIYGHVLGKPRMVTYSQWMFGAALGGVLNAAKQNGIG